MSEPDYLDPDAFSHANSLGDIYDRPVEGLAKLMAFPTSHLGDQASDNFTICTLSESGIECRVCSSNDGTTSSSALGVFLCMMVMMGLAAIKNRPNRRDRLSGKNCHANRELDKNLRTKTGAER